MILRLLITVTFIWVTEIRAPPLYLSIDLPLLVYSVNFEHAVLHYDERNDYIEILSISVIFVKNVRLCI